MQAIVGEGCSDGLYKSCFEVVRVVVTVVVKVAVVEFVVVKVAVVEFVAVKVVLHVVVVKIGKIFIVKAALSRELLFHMQMLVVYMLVLFTLLNYTLGYCESCFVQIVVKTSLYFC